MTGEPRQTGLELPADFLSVRRAFGREPDQFQVDRCADRMSGVSVALADGRTRRGADARDRA